MKIKTLLILVILGSPLYVAAQIDGVEYDWQEKKNKQGIVIFTSSVKDSSFKAVRGVMTVNASIASLVALVEDMPACSDWAALCKESRIEERISVTESYVYVYNDVPFPVSDRDVYAHVVWTKDPETQRVTMTSTATAGGTPKTGAVRIKDAVSQWHFTTNEDGTTKVENFAHINPNGPTPAWVTNMMLVDSPFKTMKNMRKIVESGSYADAKVPLLEKL
ncbi:MAG: hypothetical protein JKX81_13425 [Arenicella sp.]|nr:hypothetical protein [Arenicella sp.]